MKLEIRKASTAPCIRVCVAAMLLAQGIGAAQGVHEGVPPLELATTANMDGFEHLGTYGIYGRVHYNMLEKTVTLKYFATQGAIDATKVTREMKSESVPYWPTAVAILDHEHLAVAGKGLSRDRNETVVEIWRVRQPTVVWAVDPGTGQPVAGLQNLGVLSKTQVLNQAVVGQDMIRGMVRIRAKPYSMFVHFYDSGDLYELDYTEAVTPSVPPVSDPYPLSKILRATPGADVPYFAPLADRNMLWMSGATHVTQGHIYSIWSSYDVRLELGASAPKQIALFDHDMDGVLDEWSQPSASENLANGLLDDNQYTEKFLRTSW